MRIIDADALSEKVCFVINNSKELVTSSVVRKAVLSLIDTQPTIEAEPVVRCKDCENWMNDQVYDDGSCFCPMLDLRTDPGFFCAGGERKKANAT